MHLLRERLVQLLHRVVLQVQVQPLLVEVLNSVGARETSRHAAPHRTWASAGRWAVALGVGGAWAAGPYAAWILCRLDPRRVLGRVAWAAPAERR